MRRPQLPGKCSGRTLCVRPNTGLDNGAAGPGQGEPKGPAPESFRAAVGAEPPWRRDPGRCVFNDTESGGEQVIKICALNTLPKET